MVNRQQMMEIEMETESVDKMMDSVRRVWRAVDMERSSRYRVLDMETRRLDSDKNR